MSEKMPDPNAKASLDDGADLLFRDWSSSSLRDDYSESFGSSFREAPAQKAPPRKKSRGWSKAWSIFFSFLPPYFVFRNRCMFGQEPVGYMTIDELQALERHLELWMYNIRSAKMQIMFEEIQLLKNKEGILKVSNEILRGKIVEETEISAAYLLSMQNGMFNF